jgi:hypothetical protein
MKTRLHVLAVLAALVLSAIWTVPVFADEQSPPPSGTVEEVSPPEADSTDESDVGDPSDSPEEVVSPEADSLLESDIGDPPDPSEENSQPVEESLTDILSQAPQGTEILVVDSEGEILPLASQEAADAIMEGDPMWCPVGVTPGGAGCTAPTDSFATMLANLTGMYGTSGPSMAGVIWVESNYVSSIYDPLATEFVISGSSLTSMADFALTINGGWTGSGTTLDPNSPSVFNVALSIINWKADVTLKNILITGVTSGSSSNSAALDIQTTKKITLTNVKVEGNSDPGVGIVHGARLYNNDGVIASPVVVTNSEFNNNEGSGLFVFSDGAITLKDVSANTNGLNGAWLVNTGASTAQAVTLTGTNIFSENGERGLFVQSKGAIKGNNLIANANGLLGAFLINDTAGIAQPVTLSGMNEFKFNGSEGLSIFSKGVVTLANITATYNNSTGVYIDNAASPVGSNVVLGGTNLLRDNYYSGLEILSNGAVSINNLSANANGVSGSGYGYGAYIDNTTASSPKPVTLTGVNEFYFNQSGGLYITSKGAITVYRLTASDTVAGIGAVLNNISGNPLSPPNVALLVYANINGNSSSGLLINSYGVVTLNNVTANDNGFYGVEVNNHTGSLPRAVVVNGSNNIHGNVSTGLVVLSLGAVTLNNIHASGNTIHGAYIYNDYSNAVGGITLNGTSSFHGNGWHGIQLTSRGAIVLKDLNATGNGRHGAFINNTSGTGNVTVGTNRANWCNSFSDNGWSGLWIESKGVVTVSNLCNYNNGDPAPGHGLVIGNYTAPTPKAVRLLGTNDFSGNFNGGVEIISLGAVTLNNIAANDNGSSGVIVQNHFDPNAPQNVTISGYGNFVNNGNFGLDIVSYGAVTLNRIYAADNTGIGIRVSNQTGTLPRGVTINGYAQAFNNNLGISILSLGAIRITNAEAAYNTGYGVYLDNDAPGAVGGITLLGTVNNFYENGTYGLFALSRGLISLADPDAWNNSLFGVVLENTNGSAGVVLSTGNRSVFNGNGGVGLEVRTNGAITAAGLWAESNGGPGVYLRNYYSGPSSPQNVTLNGVNDFHLNGSTGLEVQSYGAITISNLNANDNGGHGAYLDNYRGNALTPKNVRLTGSSAFYGNGDSGLIIDSLGVIIGNNISASSNGQYGAFLKNQWDFGFFGVTLTSANNFDGNFSGGLVVYSNGAVSISNLSASWNANAGAVIDTYNPNQLAVVTLSGRNYFLGNSNSGLEIRTNAAISLSNVMANWNGGTGAYLNNYDAQPNSGPSATIRISGTNSFNGNGMNGLYLLAFGHVYLYNITADSNDPANLSGGSGVVGYSHSGSVLISCGSMTQNGLYGWNLTAATTVTLKNVNAYGNGVANSFLASGTPIISRSCP